MLTASAYLNYTLPPPSLCKKNQTVGSGSGIGMWTFGPGPGRRVAPRLKTSSSAALTQSAYLNHSWPDPSRYKETRQPAALFAPPYSRPPSVGRTEFA